MKRIKCDNCGKRYDAGAHDFCPRCGRRPPRTETGGNTGHFQFTEPPVREPDQPPVEPPGAAASRRGGVLVLRLLIVLGLAVCAGLIVWGVARSMPAAPQAIALVEEAESPFAVGALTVEVEDVSWVDLDRNSRLWWSGFDLLAVDVTVTGGDEVDWDYPTGEIYLSLEGGHYLPVLEDSTAIEMLSDMGVEAMTAYDLTWWEPAEGSLLFYVPKGFERAELCLEERTGRDEKERVEAIHTYSLTLPAREEETP